MLCGFVFRRMAAPAMQSAGDCRVNTAMKIDEIMAPAFNQRPWLTGKCFDFALALHERMPDAEFVVIGSPQMPNHVALRRGGIYYDVRGAIPDARTFLAHHGDNWAGDPAELIMSINRDDVELNAGVAGFPPPYKGNRDIAAARRAVDAVYGKRKRITEDTAPLSLPATPELIDRAKQFVLRKWRERAQERQVSEPADLSSACKFASLFAQRIFGGQLRGNWDHQYLVLPNGQRLDLTEPSQNLTGIQASGRDPYRHDRRFWNNREHRESMASCEPRVNQWVKEFLAEINI